MSILEAILMGLVEGLTEFIPVSSTGHLILAGHVLNLSGISAESFQVFIQFGAILAVVVLYPKRFLGLLHFPGQGGMQGYQGLLRLAAGCAPVFIAGPLLESGIKDSLFGPVPVAAALIVGGIVMIIAERLMPRAKTASVDEISYGQCFLIGVAQCAALWPGVSRSAATIIGGLLVGLERKTSAEFSFLLAVPVIAAASLFDLLKHLPDLQSSDAIIFLTGFFVSFLSGVVAIRFFVALLSKHSLIPFGIYRVILGAVVIALLAS